ncbi:MAG: phasin family protein [Chromatiaceae bacterium]|nr:phasin family protein [Gammaproteobacteria bacterium]MCP5306284.1 phasin family protein [Chromatiaceae bacterium]MCP5315801.1 phasin family protein [Chromatiaceae bacterium]
MQNEILEMVNQFNANFFASAKRLGELNMRTFEQLANKQAAVLNECMESSAKQYEVLASAKDYKSAMAAQSELVKGCNEKFLANLRDTAEMLSSVREELTGMVEEAVKYTTASVEKAGQVAKKKAA